MNTSTKTFNLNGTWQLSYGPQQKGAAAADPKRRNWQSISASVPGNVELDLMQAGKLPDLSVGENIYALRELEGCAWAYRRQFDAPVLAAGEHAELVFEGIDCLATIWLNGQRIGDADNMLIAHRFDVTQHLRAGQSNELLVHIDSPVLAARQRVVDPGEFGFETNFESLAVRKAPHMYGWDILPRLVSAGLWRGVHLDILPPTRWRQIYFATTRVWLENATAAALLDWDFATDKVNVDDLKIRVRIFDEGGAVHESEQPVFGTHGRVFLDLKNVKFWWPRGYGEPHLYQLSVDLLDASGNSLDRYQTTVGIRTAELEHTDLTSPEGTGQFVFKINGQPIFIHGTNWVPLDSLHSRDPQHLGEVFDMIVDLNCNMIRCWGGNVYEDHAFFDLCDRHGVMVWQDFALACAIYPQDDAFAHRIEKEAASVVAKLRHHPALVLWAGNNEIDEAHEWARTKINPNTDRLSRQTLPAVTRRLDPLRPYLPSSPYRAPAFFEQKDTPWRVLPEQHLWGPRDDFKGPFYTTSAVHFASEIGYHGCPDVASLKQMMDADHLWPWQDNPQWRAHAACPHPNMHKYDYRIPLMAKQIGFLFGSIPENLEDFVLASQISQAEALKFFIEWFRSAKWRRTGILWWNLRDGWPVISDAVVDFYNRKKMAYHYIKRVQSDVCVICREPQNRTHELAAVNDTLQAVRGQVQVRDVDSDRTLHEGSFEIERNGISTIGNIPQSDVPGMWDISWTLSDGRSAHNHYLVGKRPFQLENFKRWLKKLREAPVQ